LHGDVYDGHVRLVPPHHFDRFQAGAGFGNHFELRSLLQDLTQSLTHQGVIVDEQDASGHQTLAPARDGAASGTGVDGKGMHNNTRVPWPGAESSARLPPTLAARSRMPRIPSPASRLGMPLRSSSKPQPLSSIST